MGQGKFPLSRKENIVTQELDGEILVYNLETNKAVCMNETSALVWSLCDGKKSVGEISQTIAKKMNAPANEDLVWLAIDKLKEEQLLVDAEKLASPFEGMNRREVIKKVGLGTMIALPVISGLVAPTAANAASAGRSSGTATISGTGSTSCGSDPTLQGNRDAACQAQTGSNCASGNAVRQPGNCNYSGAGTGDTSTFGCLCA